MSDDAFRFLYTEELRIHLEALLLELRTELASCPPVYAAEFFGNVDISSELFRAVSSGIADLGASTSWNVPDSGTLTLFGTENAVESVSERITRMSPKFFGCFNAFVKALTGEEQQTSSNHLAYPVGPITIAICSAVRLAKNDEPESLLLPTTVEGPILYKRSGNDERIIYPDLEIDYYPDNAIVDANYAKGWSTIREALPKTELKVWILRTPLLQAATVMSKHILGLITAPSTTSEKALKSVAALLPLNDTESNIVGAISQDVMTGEKIAAKLGYPFNSNFKSVLSSLRKRGILENMSPGYRLVARPDKGQD